MIKNINFIDIFGKIGSGKVSSVNNKKRYSKAVKKDDKTSKKNIF